MNPICSEDDLILENCLNGILKMIFPGDNPVTWAGLTNMMPEWMLQNGVNPYIVDRLMGLSGEDSYHHYQNENGGPDNPELVDPEKVMSDMRDAVERWGRYLEDCSSPPSSDECHQSGGGRDTLA